MKAVQRLFLFIVAVSFALWAEEKKSVEQLNYYTHNIGAGAGFTTGLGLSYRHWFPNSWGVQVNLVPFVNNSNGYREVFASGGLTGLKIFKQARVVNLFGYAGIHGLYQSSAPQHATPDTANSRMMVYLGVGPGLDIHFWRLSVNIMAGIAGRFVDRDDWGMQMTGETALYYSF